MQGEEAFIVLRRDQSPYSQSSETWKFCKHACLELNEGLNLFLLSIIQRQIFQTCMFVKTPGLRRGLRTRALQIWIITTPLLYCTLYSRGNDGAGLLFLSGENIFMYVWTVILIYYYINKHYMQENGSIYCKYKRVCT